MRCFHESEPDSDVMLDNQVRGGKLVATSNTKNYCFDSRVLASDFYLQELEHAKKTGKKEKHLFMLVHYKTNFECSHTHLQYIQLC